MKNYFVNFFASSIIFYSIIYVWSVLLGEKINYKKFKFYLIWIFLACFSVFNYFFINNFIRLGFLLIILNICCKLLFNHNLKETIVVCIYEQFIIMVSETIFALLLTILKIDVNLTLNFAIVNLISNILIAIISLIIIRIKFIKKLYLSILGFTDRIKKIQLSLFSILLMLFANVLSMNVYYKIKFEYLLIFNVSMTMICIIIMFYSLKTQNKYNKVYDKYNIAINSLKDYENMMNKYRVANHENKNILLTVRAMILSKEKDIPKFIDSFIEDKYENDEKLLFETSVIPMGGLRATMYSEILKIKNNKIKYYLNIDKNISSIDLIEIDENIIIDICKIIGVFIDNAIDEEKNKKNKQIDISMYLDDGNLNIKVSNHYKGIINIERIYDEGYSTKGKNHGYGLSLVRNIVSTNSLLQNQIELSKNVFSQILTIKYKK